MKTPNYVTTEDCKYLSGFWDDKVLPVGSFVRPIDPRYLPSHIKDSVEFRWYDPETEVFVYCHFGIVKIKLNQIRRT